MLFPHLCERLWICPQHVVCKAQRTSTGIMSGEDEHLQLLDDHFSEIGIDLAGIGRLDLIGVRLYGKVENRFVSSSCTVPRTVVYEG